MRTWEAKDKIIEFLEDDPNWELMGVNGNHIIAKQNDCESWIQDLFDKHEDGVYLSMLLNWEIDSVDQYMEQVRKFDAVRHVPSVAILEEYQVDDEIRNSDARNEWLAGSGVHDEVSDMIFVEVRK